MKSQNTQKRQNAQKRQIVNIVNFIRGCEPREPMDLVTPVREQIRLMKELGLPGTFLIQYDAMLNPEFTDLLKDLDPEQFELGVWHEIVEPMTEACGIPWTGRFPWDWHVYCGFPLGYAPEQRELLADALFEKFREVFGRYPRVFGSWVFDSHTLTHVAEKYGLDAACNCKEQHGTDGYTLWGGYYNQGYYPSRENVFLPAVRPEDQLDVPVFRMLGPDQVYQYDCGVQVSDGSSDIQGVVTLEPVYVNEKTGGGGVNAWTDWYLRENFNGECLSFGYAQAGQENSFGWPAMAQGLEYQFRRFLALREAGELSVEKLGDTGKWYRETYEATPASCITAHGAFDDPHRETCWYSCRNYRVNLDAANGVMHVRDLHLFSPAMRDPYADAVCTGNEAAYESFPVIDGNRNTGNGILAGLWFADFMGMPLRHSEMSFEETGENEARVTFGSMEVLLREDGITFRCSPFFSVKRRIGRDGGHLVEIVSETERELTLSYQGAQCRLVLERGVFSGETALSEDGEIRVRFEFL